MKEDIAAEIRASRRNARRCRELAVEVHGFDKEQLEHLAEQWERRAIEAESRLRGRSGRSARDFRNRSLADKRIVAGLR
jgi:hypothetical protein